MLGALLAPGVASEARAQTPLTTVEEGTGVARLQLNYDGGFYIPGTFNPTSPADSIPATGAGTRLMWYPAKAAFRAGRVNDTQWDASNVGVYSVAFGRNTQASGPSATAMGFRTTASGRDATAMGEGTTASGNRSTAMGDGTIASGIAATAMGDGTTASGRDATAMGEGTTASAFFATAMGAVTKASGTAATSLGDGTIASGGASTAMGTATTAATRSSLSIGQFNSANTSVDNTLFVAGNGSANSRSDALVLDKSGNLEVSGSFILPDGTQLTEASDLEGLPTNSNGAFNLTNDNGVVASGTFGSGSVPATGAGTRMMWYPNKAAFRAGRVGVDKDGTQWDLSNVGDYSVALGVDTKASGRAAVAMGSQTTASGIAATAMGEGTTASENNATAMGNRTTASGRDATAMGSNTTAATNSSLSIGRNNSANTSDDNTLFVAGNGPANSRSDALVLKKDGDFGLSTSDPVAHLHVQESVKESGATNLGRHAGVVENTSTEGGADVFALKTALNDPSAITNFISFLDADEQIGTIQGTGGGIELTSNTADFAEELPVADGAEVPDAADLVGVRGGTVTLDTEGADRVMIASTAPIITGNATPATGADDARRVAVAFVGQVPAKLRGSVEVGDLIVASGKDDGTARAVAPSEYRRAEHGPIAGQAWSAKASEEVGEVTVAVGLGRSGAVAERLEQQQKQIDALKKRVWRVEPLRKRVARLEARSSGGSIVAGLPGGTLLLAFLVGGLLGAGLLWRRRAWSRE
jgi:hypothetical protein